jgi:hypothetical protein
MVLSKGIRLIALLLVFMQVSACVGAAFIHGRTREYGQQLKESTVQKTVEEILKKRGEPDKIRCADEKEWWYYDRKVAWRGPVLYLIIIPIPLLVPIGRNETVYEFHNGMLTNKVVKETTVSGGSCGLLPYAEGCCYWGCDSF